MKPFWITFYSYKGGVGRSMALANIAALLTKRGRRVALIDFDLEAPGLDSFEEFKCIAGKPGVVEYVTEYKSTGRAPDIEDYIHPCELHSKTSAAPTRSSRGALLRGKLWIIPAGKKDAAYNSSRAKLNWADLYENHEGELFVENWKAAINRHCTPDYVLVDSRTGLTDVGGICTLHLPDLVLMLFGLNQQNVKGIATVARTIRESGFTRFPQIHYVASPVPNMPRDPEGALDKRFSDISAQLATKIESTIRYQAAAALTEKLFVLEEYPVDNPLVSSYERLLSKLIAFNRSGLDFLLWQTDHAITNVDTALARTVEIVLREEFPDRAEALLALAKLRKAQHPEEAKSLAQQALAKDPAFREAQDWLLSVYSGEQKPHLALKLLKQIHTQIPADSIKERDDFNFRLAEFAMAAGDYSTASEASAQRVEYAKELEKRGDLDPTNRLIVFFNDAEARRRSTGDPQVYFWPRVIVFFEIAEASGDATMELKANRWQAMHIPLALTGELGQAKEALQKAKQAASLLGPTDRVFTVKRYLRVPVQEFLKDTDEMLAALDKGQLWDGMPLPPAGYQTRLPLPKTPKPGFET